MYIEAIAIKNVVSIYQPADWGSFAGRCEHNNELLQFHEIWAIL